MKLSQHLLLFSVLSLCLAAFQIGCWQKNDKNPVSASPDSNFASSVAFKIVTPANQATSFSAAIRSSAESQAMVTIQLKLANFGNSLTPFSLVKKQAPVVNGSATVTFESLPNTTVVGSLQIENGNINGFSNFHGAADLNQGSNIVELAPIGSLMPQDVLANAVSEIVSSSTLLLKAPTTLATELARIVSNLPLDSTSVYDEVLNNFSNRTGLPLVELLAPANTQTFTIGSSINIIASATDLDGSILKIEFYQNSIKIGEKSSLPFSLEWQPSATGTYAVYAKAIDNNAAVGVTASISVIVVDSAPTHTVTYNGNGNTSGLVPIDNQSYQSGATVAVKDNTGSLTKTGYTFAGWNTAADGSGTSYNTTATFNISTTNVTLYAKWQSSAYSWTPGNATVSETNFAVGRPTAIYSGSSFSSPNAVDGNTMSRWEGNRNDPGPDETNPHFLIVDLQQNREVRSIKVNISGWDSWKQNFSVFTSTDLQNWSLVASEQDKTGIFSYNLQPTSVRYVKFSSTYSADNGQVNLYELEVYGTEQVANAYSVNYNGNGNNGGSVPTDNQTYQFGSTVTVKDNTGNLIKTGYTFAGWNTAADGSGTSYNPAATFNMGAANITFYAKWSPIPTYAVTYNGNGNTGGSVPTDNLTYQQNATVTVKNNTGSLAKTGYTFAGWNTAADGSGTSYNPAATFNMDGANVILYAKWHFLINPHNVIYDGNGANSGNSPIDSNLYEANASVVVLPNSGNLGKTGYTFDCWNTKADGSGFSYIAGSTLAMSATDLILYAKWRSNIPTWVYSPTSKSEVNYALGRPSASNSNPESCPSAVDGSNDTRWSSNRTDFGPDEANPHFLIVDLEQERDIKRIKVNIAGWGSYEQDFSIQISSDLENWVTVASEEKKTGIRSYFVTKTARYVKFVSTYSADNGQVNLYELEVYGEIPTTYGVTYNGNGNTGGEIPTDAKNYAENDTVDVKDAGSLVKVGRSFVCWNTSPDGFGQNYFGSSNFNIGNSDVTLFAKWTSETPATIVSAKIGNLIGVPSGFFHRDSSNSDNISYVSAFRMSQCEITQAQFVEITGLPNPSSFTTGSNLPVNRTSWYQTLVFCNKLSLLEGLEPAYIIDNSTNPDDWGPIPTNYDDSWDNVLCDWAASGYRLPTEAEWQWAAMGATDNLTKPFSGTGSLSDSVWYSGNSGGTTHVVGTKLPNELGIYDMTGNVREWCWDWAANYPTGAKVDYRGPTNGTYRIARGDSYFDSDGWLFVFQRDLDVPYYPRSNLETLGFRVVRQ